MADIITGEPLHPIFSNTAAGGNFCGEDKAPVSPLHCAAGSFSELQFPPFSRPETIELLKAVWLLIHSVAEPSTSAPPLTDPASNYHQARKAISRMPELSLLETGGDHIYECCCLFARLLLIVTESHLPLSSCVENHQVVYQLEQHMRVTETSVSWGSFRGVYFNVLITAYIASINTNSCRYFQGLLLEAFEYYSYSAWEGAYRPLVKLKRFQDFFTRGSVLRRSPGLYTHGSSGES